MPDPEPRTADRPSPFERLGTAAVITLAGAGAYGTLRALYAIYYGLLGSTPEQVGLGYVETLSQGAFALSSVLALGAAGWFLLTHMFTAFSRKLARPLAELANRRTWVGSVVAFVVGVGFGLGGLMLFLGTPSIALAFDTWWQVVAAWIGLWLLAANLISVMVNAIAIENEPAFQPGDTDDVTPADVDGRGDGVASGSTVSTNDGTPEQEAGSAASETAEGRAGVVTLRHTIRAIVSTRRRRFTLALVLSILVMGSVAATIGTAYAVRAGRQVPAIVANITGLRADPVILEWREDAAIAEEVRPTLEQTLRYLGENDGVSVVYAPDVNTAVRVPTSELAIVRRR